MPIAPKSRCRSLRMMQYTYLPPSLALGVPMESFSSVLRSGMASNICPAAPAASKTPAAPLREGALARHCRPELCLRKLALQLQAHPAGDLVDRVRIGDQIVVPDVE